MTQFLTIAGAKGGAGATTCAVGLGMAMAAGGARVLIADGDMRYPCAAAVAGCGEERIYTLEEARKGACRVKQAVIEHPTRPNLSFLPCAGCRARAYISVAIKEAGSAFDYVLCDRAARDICRRGIVVCEPYPLSIRLADMCLNELRDGGYSELDVIFNKVNGGLIYDRAIAPPEDVAELLHAGLAGVIPEDLTMPLGGMRRESVRAFKLAAARVAGGGRKVFDPNRGYGGAYGYLKRAMRKKL